MLELEARSGIHAGLLPSNARGAEAVDGLTGMTHTPEQSMRGWTSQQPFSHVDCPVMHRCIMCGKPVDPDELRDHFNVKCRVLRELRLEH